MNEDLASLIGNTRNPLQTVAPRQPPEALMMLANILGQLPGHLAGIPKRMIEGAPYLQSGVMEETPWFMKPGENHPFTPIGDVATFGLAGPPRAAAASLGIGMTKPISLAPIKVKPDAHYEKML